MTKRKAKPKAKRQQPADDEEIKKHIRRDLIDLADKLKRLAARFETCGFMPSINRYAQQVSWKSAELYADIALKVWPGDSKGETHYSLKPSDALSLDDAYAKDLLQKVMALTEKTYLSKASPQQASIEMMRVADFIQKDLLKHEEDKGLIEQEGKTSTQESDISTGNDSEEPEDLITLAVAVKEFCVSRSTLKRRIYGHSIRDYRKSRKGLHRVSRNEIARNFTKL